jgi:hypothetical protein
MTIQTNHVTNVLNGTGVTKLQSNGVTTNALAWGSYAYVGTGSTPTLRSSYNISSITRNSAGNYTFAFTTALTDANYSVLSGSGIYAAANDSIISLLKAKTTSSFTLTQGYVTAVTPGTLTPYDYGVDFAVFGN